MRPIFIFAYYSYKDPVFQSSVLPYFTKPESQEKRKIILLTWEQNQFELSDQEVGDIKRDLKEQDIFWYKVKWHSGRFKMLKKAYDFIFGFFFSFLLVLKYKVSVIYSEGFPGAIISHFVSLLSQRPHIIHTFEPHADYMADAGVWKRNSWEYLLIKYLEITIANYAKAIITATSAYKEILEKKGVNTKIVVLPSCIDTEVYKFSAQAREKIRTELNIKNDQVVITYLGKLGGMYMEEELFKFFSQCLQFNPEKFRFFLFTKIAHDSLKGYLQKYCISEKVLLCKYLKKEDVPAYLSASDIGFCAVRPIPSQRYSSPIKNGEYWACGLPIIIPEGVSDDFILVRENLNTGILIETENRSGLLFSKLIPKLLEFSEKEKNEIVEVNRNMAINNREIRRAKRIIEKLLS